MERLFIAMFLMVLFFPMSLEQYQSFSIGASLEVAEFEVPEGEELASDIVGDIGGGDDGSPSGVEALVTRDAKSLLRSKLEETFQTTEDFQSQLQYYMTLRETMLFGASPNSDVLIGKDGWLYLSESLAGRDLRSEDISWLADQLQELYAKTRRNGVDFVVAVIPDKKTVADEYLPSTLRLDAEESIADLEKELEGIPFVNVLDLFESVSRQDCLYSALDTHWSPYGAYLAFSEIAEILGLSAPGIEGVTDYERKGDLSHLLGLDELEETCAPVLESIPLGTPEGKLLFFGDSFGEGLVPFFEDFFAEIDFHLIRAENPLDLEDADLQDVDVLLVEVVQRDLRFLLPEDIRVAYE